MLLRSSILLLICSFLGRAACVAVTGEQIRVSDLASTQSGLEGLSPSLVYSFAPTVGGQRVLAAADIERWAAAHGLTDFRGQTVCFERPAWQIGASDVEAAVKSMFPSASNLQVDVIEVCNCLVPHGELRFPLTGVSAPPQHHPDALTTWHGNVVSESQRTFPIWVRLRVVASRLEVRATADLPANQAIRLDQLEEVSIMDSPLRRDEAHAASEYPGMIPNRTIRRGEVLNLSLVSPPLMIERGAMVKVDVIDGATQLAFEAKAETSGHAGELITLLNPTSLERFQARVTGPGTSEIVLGKSNITRPNTLEKNTSANPTMPKKSL